MAKSHPSKAAFRFYAELNDFLPGEDRQQNVPFLFYVSPTVKDAIEALGVPHVEIDLILVNGRSVDFGHRLSDGDRVSVYPVFESLDLSPVIRLRGRPLRDPTFVADVHLRRLTRLMRLLGFDVLYSSTYDDPALVRISVGETRILLTRDRALLKRGELTHGYWVRSTDPIEQVKEVVRRFDLGNQARPFSRCLTCNGPLHRVEKEDVLPEIPPKTARWREEYVRCQDCGKLYWQGTHHARLENTVKQILSKASP